MIHKPATILVLVFFFQLTACIQQQQSDWQLDTSKSKVTWNTGNMMGGHVGYFLFQSGSMQFTAANEPVSGVFYMDMNSIRSTDNPNEAGRKKTDASLRDNSFFASNQYPLASMVVKKVTRIGSSLNYTVVGDLTIKGITHPIEFAANIDTKAKTSHITAKVSISHQLWKINYKPNPVDLLSGQQQKPVPDIHVFLDLMMRK
jgi:polyisoprenoid-binding protein YceI